jgi:hypothetical protein
MKDSEFLAVIIAIAAMLLVMSFFGVALLPIAASQGPCQYRTCPPALLPGKDANVLLT